MFALHKKQEELNLRLSKIEKSKLSANETKAKAQLMGLQMKEKAKSLISFRCKDSSKDKESKPKAWNGTATKISEDAVLTAHHLISFEGDYKERKLPINCDLYSQGTLVGTYASIKDTFKQVGEKDMVLIKIKFNTAGQELPLLGPAITPPPQVGETLVLISHPSKFINDWIISYGLVLNENANKLLTKNLQSYWSRAIITDMSAAGGSSGSPLFSLDGEFIGIHVGGEREKGLNVNYQLLFDSSFLLHYGLFKLTH